ncbi:MAG TPA: hypothetical protein VFE31_03810 [Opitutaceae bacterium]|nr:hypothetical protein [Opitutaceae bacterium]
MKSSAAPYLGQGNVNPASRSELLQRVVWGIVQATLFRWSPRFCHGFRAGLLRAFGADIPEPRSVQIFPTCRVLYPRKLHLGPHALLGPGVRIYNLARIEVQRGANISQDCHLCAGTHDYRRWSMPLVARPIVVGANAWLCAEVFIGPGVTVGELAVVGARSAVRGDIPPRQVCAGNPCVPLKPRPPPQP